MQVVKAEVMFQPINIALESKDEVEAVVSLLRGAYWSCNDGRDETASKLLCLLREAGVEGTHL